MNSLKEIHHLGQSIWLDFFNREIMDSGKLMRLIQEDKLRGITSNPSIFESAVSESSDYDHDIRTLAKTEKSIEDIFFKFAITDIKRAADLLKPIYDETEGQDGFVSMEVSPHLANNTQATIEQARALWESINRKNVMIKIPGTQEGLAAIRHCVSHGLNINVTLLFGLERYREVALAYIAGLEDRLQTGKPIEGIASVASFFLSRIDVLVDPVLKEKGLDELVGQIAIASAKEAYQIYKEIFQDERFKKLEKQGANKQRVLWASTSTKDPSFSDVKYVEALIGPDTVNTLPLKTMDAFRDHGKAENRLEKALNTARKHLQQLSENGIKINEITQQLEEEGVQKFNEAYDKLMKAINEKKLDSKHQ